MDKERDWFDEETPTTTPIEETTPAIPVDFFPMPVVDMEGLPPIEQAKLALMQEIRETLWEMKFKRKDATYKQLAETFDALFEKYIVLLGGSTQRMEVNVVSDEQRQRIAHILSENTVIDIPVDNKTQHEWD